MMRLIFCTGNWTGRLVGGALLLVLAGCAGAPSSGRLASQPSAAQVERATGTSATDTPPSPGGK